MRSVLKVLVVAFAIIGVVSTVQVLRGQEGAPLAGAGVAHVGIMVTDMAKTVKAFEEAFGVTVPAAKEVGPLPLLAGTPNAATSKVAFTQVTFGSTVFEFIQPLAGPGPHRDHIDKFGQGLQHIAFTVKDPKATITRLVAFGGKQTMANYVDLKDQLGFTAELLGQPR